MMALCAREDMMSADELQEKLERTEQGLAELRQMVLRQEGAVLMLRELVAEARAREEKKEDAPGD